MASCVEDDDKFQSYLDEPSKQKAKDELHELNDEDRKIAVHTLRQWVIQQDWLRTPTDFEFLLRFLRCRKFSQLEARKTLENYWTIKTKVPEWFSDVDPADETIQEILRTGFYCSPKARGKNGCRYILECQGRIDINQVKTKWGVDAVFKATGLVCDWVNRDENVQVNGVKVLIDSTNMSMAHLVTLLNPENSKKIVSFYQKSLPSRMKGLHIYKEPAFFDAAFALIAPFVTQKTKDRMMFHGKSLAKVYDHFDKTCLPVEYLPDEYKGPCVGTRDDIVEAMIADMMKPEFRDYIKNLSSSKYGVDLKKRAQDDAPVESFRKLNVD